MRVLTLKNLIWLTFLALLLEIGASVVFILAIHFETCSVTILCIIGFDISDMVLY